MRFVSILLYLFSLTAVSQPLAERPNILVVVLDDVGFMGLGAYGSDAKTPNIDEIAQRGVQLNRYYTANLCGPSRAMLMTGQTSHQIGMPTLVEALSPEMAENDSYSMEWKKDQHTLASRLQGVGYQTFASGKWGIGRVGKNLPHKFGFDRSFVLDATGASNYSEKPYLPLYKEVKWFEDGERISLPDDFYSSRDLVNKMIDYIDGADLNKPFFGYLSLQAVHIPVQVPKSFIDKYNGVFDQGWDIKRQQRLKTAKKLALVPESTQLAPAHSSHKKWDELSLEDKAYWSRVMQVNAGMTEAADEHIGRLFTYLKTKGVYENTIVIVTSDNGAEFNTIGKGEAKGIVGLGQKLWMKNTGWDVELKNLGQPGSLAAIGREWASVSAAPLSLYKFNSSEGGQRVPFVIAGPNVKNLGLIPGRSVVTDITPTLLDAANVPYQKDEFYGRSIMPMLSGQVADVWGNDSFVIEVSGNISVYKNNWKLVKVKQPLGDEQWHLFDVVADPSEMTDLASQHAKIFQQLLNEYQAYAKRYDVHKLQIDESAVQQVTINAVKKIIKDNWLRLLLVLLLVAGLIVLFKRKKRS